MGHECLAQSVHTAQHGTVVVMWAMTAGFLDLWLSSVVPPNLSVCSRHLVPQWEGARGHQGSCEGSRDC